MVSATFKKSPYNSLQTSDKKNIPWDPGQNFVNGDETGRMRPWKRGPLSQQIQHDKDPFPVQRPWVLSLKSKWLVQSNDKILRPDLAILN